jgi:hypothetical protein
MLQLAVGIQNKINQRIVESLMEAQCSYLALYGVGFTVWLI